MYCIYNICGIELTYKLYYYSLYLNKVCGFMKFKKIIAGIMSGICLISGSVFPVTVNAADYKPGDLNNDSILRFVDFA